MKKYLELLFMKQLKGIGNATINSKYINSLATVNGIDECIEIIKKNESRYSDSELNIAKQLAESKYREVLSKPDISVITLFDECYPNGLRDLKNKKPVFIYVRGSIDSLKCKGIAIVGTRKPSVWSMKVEDKLVKKVLEISEMSIISGLALGCDCIAHEATINSKGKTIAVLPSGVDTITPISHRKLADSIVKSGGCIISEYDPGAKATKSTYVERDSIIAALAGVTMVIECGIKSGTMHTVDAAEKMQRRVACYYCNNMQKGNYEGNLYIANNKNAFKISDTDDLKTLLADSNKNIFCKNKQLSFEDIYKSL